jgi:hypothetical protein
MSTAEKSKFLQIRLQPELLAIAHKMADAKRRTVSSMIRDLIYLEAGKWEVEKKKEEMKEALQATQTGIPHPDSFQLEPTAPAAAKQAQKPKLGRKERRLKKSQSPLEAGFFPCCSRGWA